MAMKTMTRRQMIRLAGSAAITLALAAACGSEDSEAGSTGVLLRSDVKLPERFRVPLPIPPVLKPVRSDAASDSYEITQRPAQAEILPGLKTEIWGYAGLFPGPTIEARSGRQAVIRHRNELPVPTVVHLHGGVTPPEHDGYPTDLVLPVRGWEAGPGADGMAGMLNQGARDYVYPHDQPAATLWYHDHRMDFTGPQVYRGLAGFHLIRDDVEDGLPLPKGEREIPLMICDRAFAEDGSFKYPAVDPSLRGQPGVSGNYMRGVLGDVILVNGAPWPYLEVTNTRYRLRILNASNARRYRLALDPPPRAGAAFTQIGSDAGLLARPVAHSVLEIAQAERFDVIVDFASYPAGTQVTLLNQLGDGATGQVMRFIVVRQVRDDSAVPARLADVEQLTRPDAAITRTFIFARGAPGAGGRPGAVWTINGRPFDPQRADAQPRLGSTEIWRLTTNAHHPVHIHLAHFQVLRRGERGPGPYDAGWKDTIDLEADETAEIAARFTGYHGRYVFHCHNLEHEDMMMMGNFETI